MDQEVKAKWIAALKSGKYKQGRDRLRGPKDKFCCLGVLCDVIDSTKWVKEPDGYSFMDRAWFFPDELCVQYDLPQVKTIVLSRMNDTERKPFSEIAHYIEENM